MKLFQFFIVVFYIFSSVIYSQNIVAGKVIDGKDNEPLLGVNIIIEELKVGTTTGLDGTFEFQNVKEGKYTIKFSYVGHNTILKKIEVPSKENLLIRMNEGSINLHEVMITGNPLSIDPKEISQSTMSIASIDLDIKRSSTIAEILNFQPGISIRSNGTATSRPVIRGFSNNRILILENGLRMGDLSNTSDDHSVSFDGSSAEKIEVLRGPASLLYGSNAIGGVINIITEAIPNHVTNKPTGTINLNSSSVNNEFSGNADLLYGLDAFGVHANYFNRKNSDYKDGNGNRTANSDQFSRGYQLGMSYIPSFGIAGLSYADYLNGYGIPLNTSVNSGKGPIKIEMKKKELKFLIESQKLESFVSSFSLKSGYQDYRQQEIARYTGETGTAFGLKSYSADISFKHKPLFSNEQGVFGLWGILQKYTVSGDEAFTPSADYKSLAAYFFEQIKFDRLNIQFGTRYEFNNIKIPDALISKTFFPAYNRNYNSLSGSLGVVYNITDEISIYSNLAGAYRSPTIEELSSYAIHEATATFDIGNKNLNNERNYGLDFGLRVNKPDHRIEVNGYYNDINNYIFRKPTNLFYNPNVSDVPFNYNNSGLQVYRYSQSNATIYGAEFKAQYEFTIAMSTTVIFDYVRGRQKDTGENLPQLPPLRFSIEQRYLTDYYWFGMQWKLAAAQNLTAAYEVPTKGYGLVDVYAGVKLLTGGFIHMFNLKITNLANQPYKEHLSAIKNFAYMPGRNIQVSYKFLF